MTLSCTVLKQWVSICLPSQTLCMIYWQRSIIYFFICWDEHIHLSFFSFFIIDVDLLPQNKVNPNWFWVVDCFFFFPVCHWNSYLILSYLLKTLQQLTYHVFDEFNFSLGSVFFRCWNTKKLPSAHIKFSGSILFNRCFPTTADASSGAVSAQMNLCVLVRSSLENLFLWC